jgi:hypothetical protein
MHEHQPEYYQALQRSTYQTDSAPFIEFMLRMVLMLPARSAHSSRPAMGSTTGEHLVESQMTK